MYLFSLGSGGWLLLLESLYLHFVKHNRFESRMESILFALAIYGLTAMLFHYIFIVKDRDQKIVDKFEQKTEENPRRNLHLTLSLSILVLPYLVMMGLALFLPRHLV
jgi:F0F1-type ATP synthase membrane subunit a